MKSLSRSEILAYMLLQQALWVLLVWGAGAGQMWWPSAVTAALLAAACWRAGSDWWKVAAVIGVGVACGIAVDGSLIKTGLVLYAGSDGEVPIPPMWIIALWAMFAATIALPARKLLTSPIVAGILGAIGGPLAYLGGRVLGAITWHSPGLILIGVFFALATPIIVLVANRLLPPAQPT